MNTKQVLYNALASQLEIKKTECDTYYDEVYTPAFENLSESIKEWFTNKINSKIEKFDFTGDKIILNTDSNSSWRDVSFVMRGWDENGRYVELDWSGDSAKTNEQTSIDKGILIGELATNFHLVENRYKTDWFPTYQNIVNARKEFDKSYEDLDRALRNLKNEIWNDSIESMKQIGFEIKSFKPKHILDWDYNGGDRKYYVKVEPTRMKIQYGRSEYDSTYINGFKVLGKKGNKYQVETYREGSNTNNTFNVLEKKMDDFINRVNVWENRDADDTKEKVEKRYAECIK